MDRKVHLPVPQATGNSVSNFKQNESPNLEEYFAPPCTRKTWDELANLQREGAGGRRACWMDAIKFGEVMSRHYRKSIAG